MSKDMHGRTHRPAGLPKGVAGTYDRNPGMNGDDIAPPMPVHDDPDILRRELASIPQRDGPEYDGLRTRLARAELRQMESKEKHATAASCSAHSAKQEAGHGVRETTPLPLSGSAISFLARGLRPLGRG